MGASHSDTRQPRPVDQGAIPGELASPQTETAKRPGAVDVEQPILPGEAPQRATAAGADALLESWFSCLKGRLPGLRVFDCHTHLGSDPDGSRQTTDELVGALDVVGGRAVAFSLSEPGGYRAANDRVLAAAEASGGRLVGFCRVDPHHGGLAEAQRGLERGARGIKLPPARRALLAWGPSTCPASHPSCGSTRACFRAT